MSGTRLNKIAFGDELGDRDLEFRNWSQNTYRMAMLESNLDVGLEATRKTVEPEKIVTKWVPVPSRLSSDNAEAVAKGKFEHYLNQLEFELQCNAPLVFSGI